MPISSIWKRDFLFLGLWWEPLENNANIFSLKTGGISVVFLACDGNLWKIISISSIWKRNFRVFSGLVMGTSFENGISVSFWAFLENNANIFYLKTGFPFFGLWWEPLENNANIFYLKRDFPFLGLWWEPLENNANIFYLKTGFPFFWACDGNLWKIIPISSIWKRNFRVFLGLWREPHLKTGFPCLFGLFWKIMPISSIWKRDFPFFGLVMATSGK